MAAKKRRKKGPSLSVGRGEKLSVKKGGGLTAKGRQALQQLLLAQPQGSRDRQGQAWQQGGQASQVFLCSFTWLDW